MQPNNSSRYVHQRVLQNWNNFNPCPDLSQKKMTGHTFMNENKVKVLAHAALHPKYITQPRLPKLTWTLLDNRSLDWRATGKTIVWERLLSSKVTTISFPLITSIYYWESMRPVWKREEQIYSFYYPLENSRVRKVQTSADASDQWIVRIFVLIESRKLSSLYLIWQLLHFNYTFALGPVHPHKKLSIFSARQGSVSFSRRLLSDQYKYILILKAARQTVPIFTVDINFSTGRLGLTHLMHLSQFTVGQQRSSTENEHEMEESYWGNSWATPSHIFQTGWWLNVSWRVEPRGDALRAHIWLVHILPMSQDCSGVLYCSRFENCMGVSGWYWEGMISSRRNVGNGLWRSTKSLNRCLEWTSDCIHSLSSWRISFALLPFTVYLRTTRRKCLHTWNRQTLALGFTRFHYYTWALMPWITWKCALRFMRTGCCKKIRGEMPHIFVTNTVCQKRS